MLQSRLLGDLSPCFQLTAIPLHAATLAALLSLSLTAATRPNIPGVSQPLPDRLNAPSRALSFLTLPHHDRRASTDLSRVRHA